MEPVINPVTLDFFSCHFAGQFGRGFSQYFRGFGSLVESEKRCPSNNAVKVHDCTLYTFVTWLKNEE